MNATLPTLDQVSPAAAWQPWQPTPADPWGRKWAAHLYRRAAFGPGREELLEAERLGPAGTLDLLLTGRPGAEENLQSLLDVGRAVAASEDSGDKLRGWWLYAMLQSGHPLREKLALFWHNHFATSITKVRSPGLMFRQNCAIRDHALGRFGPFLQAISQDGAMLVWLDSNRNIKGKPNENFARELMELFSLGVGNYTEADIREVARAFTGWHTDGERFRFKPELHDAGSKTVFGKTGNWDGGDIVKIVLEQPAAARFLVRKLYAFYVSEVPPPDALLEPLCESFRKTDYDITGLLRTMVSSRHFYSAHSFRQRVKGPVEYVLGAVRAVYREYPESDPEYRPLPTQVLVPRLAAMGQALFAPPNVKGWRGGRDWLTTSTMLERANFAAALATGTLWTAPGGPDLAPAAAMPQALDPARVVTEERVARPEDIARVLLDLYVPGGVRPVAHDKLMAFLAAGAPTGADLADRVREAVHAVLSIPESQLA